LPRHGNPSSPHRGHGFCRGGTWKSPSFPELGGIRRAAKNGNPRAPRDPGGGFRRAVTWKLEVPHTWAAVSVMLRHGTPEYPVLGLRFPSRRDMGTPGFPDLGKFSAVPRNGNPEFLQIGAAVRRVAKWKRVCMRRDMEKKKKKPGVPRGLDPRFRNTTSSLDSGDGFHRHGNPEFPVWRKKHGNPRFSSGGGTWKPQVSRARARPSAVCREMETPISLACFPRGRGRTRKPQVPQAWAGFTPCRDTEIWGFHATDHKFRRLATPLAATAWKPQISRPQARNAFSKMRTKETTFE